jgi:hypothetical protein
MAAGLVDLRKAGEKFARSQFLPDLGVVVSAQVAYTPRADPEMRTLYYNDRFNYSRLVLALALNWTLDFHNQAFGLKKVRAERREAEAQREAANLLLALEVERAYRDLLEAEQGMRPDRRRRPEGQAAGDRPAAQADRRRGQLHRPREGPHPLGRVALQALRVDPRAKCRHGDPVARCRGVATGPPPRAGPRHKPATSSTHPVNRSAGAPV